MNARDAMRYYASVSGGGEWVLLLPCGLSTARYVDAQISWVRSHEAGQKDATPITCVP